MKKRLWIGAVAAALAVGGVSAGLIGASKAAPVEATTPTYTKIYLKLNATYWGQATAYYTVHIFGGDADTTWPGVDLGGGSGTDLLSADIPTAQAGYTGVTLVRWQEAAHTTEWNRAELKNFTAEQYNYFTNTAWDAVTGSTLAATHNVSEYAVVGGAKEATAFKTEIAGSEAFAPSATYRAGYTFGGWFTDEACTASYTAAVLSADTSLYAKFTACVATKYFYFQSMTWSAAYVYTFGQSQAMGAFPGTKVTAVTEMVSFRPDTSTGGYANDWGGIYKVAYYSDSGDTKMVLSDGTDTNKSKDLVITEGAFYDLTNIQTADYAGAADKGAAAKVIYDINAAQKAVAAAGSILAGSVCGISRSDATALAAEYNALTADEKKMCDQSNLTTYNYADRTGTKVAVSFYQVVEQLNLIAASGSGTASIHDTIHDNSGLFITLGVLTAGLTAAGAMIFIAKKRKHAIR